MIYFFRDDADWFLKADDDTYIVMDNLRAFLSMHDTGDPLQFGCKLRQIEPRGYMSGGAGYVLSKEALKRFVTRGLVRKLHIKLTLHTIAEILCIFLGTWS